MFLHLDEVDTLDDLESVEIVDTEHEVDTGRRYIIISNDVILHYLDVDTLDDVDADDDDDAELEELKVGTKDHLLI